MSKSRIFFSQLDPFVKFIYTHIFDGGEFDQISFTFFIDTFID